MQNLDDKKIIILEEKQNQTSSKLDFRAIFPDIWFTVFDYIPNFSKEYYEQLSQGACPVIKNNAIFHKDSNLPYVTCKDNVRVTHHIPENPTHTIHMLGSSYLYGHMSKDEETIPSYLQELCNIKFKNKYIFKNYAVRGINIGLITILQLKELPILKDDIIIIYSDNNVHLAILAYLYQMSVEKQAKFCFILHPRIQEIINPSNLEQFYIKFGVDVAQYKKWTVKKDAITDITTCTTYNEPTLITRLKKIRIPCFDTQKSINRPHQQGEIFFDADHVCAKGNKLIANYIFKYLLPELDKQVLPNRKEQAKLFLYLNKTEILPQAYMSFALKIKEQYQNNKSIHQWLKSIPLFCSRTNNGAIIMNSNPFTNGHLHLIETALKEVDNLYIFVVQEDKSEFSFSDRIDLVKKGTAHLGDKIKVIPSGEFIISSITFPEYFDKSHTNENIKVDTTNDIAIFGAIIAPKLNISVRFVGEEPNCHITSQYNQHMLELLPNLGIKFIQIPRISYENTPISASYVRELLGNALANCEHTWYKIKKIVPITTYEYLLRHRIKN